LGIGHGGRGGRGVRGGHGGSQAFLEENLYDEVLTSVPVLTVGSSAALLIVIFELASPRALLNQTIKKMLSLPVGNEAGNLREKNGEKIREKTNREKK
jgi:hypothetical protein